MKIIKGIGMVFLVAWCLLESSGQELKLATYGVSPRDVEQDNIEKYFDVRYNGLTNVGKETKVFLKGYWDDSTLTSPTWTFLEKPAGSAAELGTAKDLDETAQLITFIPDVVGAYKIIFSDGSSSDTIRISAGLYLGVTEGDINCVTCHNTNQWDYKYDAWLGTGHSKALTKGLNGEKGSYFNNDCVQCHSVGYDTFANNNGFDDWPFEFPDTLKPGMSDSLTAIYPDAMARGNVQCEQCHGPGSEHFGNKFNISAAIGAENCNYCHNAGTHHVYGEQWLHSGEDATEFDGRGFEGGHGKGSYISMGTRNGCAPCHSGAGFVQWSKEGRPVNEDGLPAAVEELPEITTHTCATCHDPHDATNEHQLRFADTQLGDGTPITMEVYGTGASCMQCHRARRNAPVYSADTSNASSHYGPHHGPQADMLLGANVPDFGVEIETSPHKIAADNTCVTCHMAGEDKVDTDKNVILVGGHSWNMSDPEGNDFVEACARCHGDIGSSFKDKKYYENGSADHDGNGIEEGVQLEVHGLMTQLALLLPPVGEDEVSVESGDPNLTPAIMKAAYTYILVEEDRSFGIHNPAFTVGLLKAAINEVGGVVSVPSSKDGLPREYSLSQNYPNPFNPSTVISFSIPTEGMTTLKIYDIVGREVASLVNEKKSAGKYSYEFNARNLSSGVYIYRLTSGNYTKTKKMIFLK